MMRGAVTVGRFPRAAEGGGGEQGGGDPTALETAASGLSAGQNTDLATTPSWNHDGDIQWICRNLYYDPNRAEIHVMGKPAQANDYAHYIYSEVNDSWTTVIADPFNSGGFGHVWSHAFDESNGDYYAVFYGGGNAGWRFIRDNGVASTSWTQLADHSDPGGWTDGTSPPLGFHPNLFGSGQGGYLHLCIADLWGYNPADANWAHIAEFVGSDSFWNRQNGQSVYLPTADIVIFYAQPENDSKGIVVHASAGTITDATGISQGFVETTTAPPVLIAGKGGGAVQGHVVNHPSDPDRLLILTENDSGSVYSSTDNGASWTGPLGYTHPFSSGMSTTNAGEFTCGDIGVYGVIAGMTSSSSGGTFRLWKPND